MSNDLLDQLAQSYVNAIVTGQREPNYLNVPYYLRPPAEALNQNALTNGAISNASWLDFNPIAKSALDTFMEASGAAPSARLVDRLVKLQSPVLRPQSAYEWADWGAGAAADTIQTGLAGADIAALAPHIGRRAANSLLNEVGAIDYRGLHTAPTRTGQNSLDNLTDIYPEDIYGPNGARYYGHGGDEFSRDLQTIDVIRSFKDSPNKDVTIYRAIPSDITNSAKIGIFEKEKKYILKHGKLPPGVETNLNTSKYYEKISDEIEKLKLLPDDSNTKININPGDWVSINRSYAVDHGKRKFGKNYKIISKKVKARELFTDGNSIHEWGWSPSESVELNNY